MLGLFAMILIGQALVIPLIFLGFLFSPGDVPVRVNGSYVPMSEVRWRALATMLAYFPFAAYVGYGLWKGNPIARHIMFGAYVLASVVLPTVTGDWSRFHNAILGYVLIGGYLYFAPNVQEYFRTFEQQSRD